ncbi:MAG: TolC family protein [Verrucomicrobiaceae bacterium]|nr:TolC family protein [Verrucomicrobiaceae bacterium]
MFSKKYSTAILIAGSFAMVGCTTGFYRKKADKDVYEILQQVEEDIFGTSSEFSIDTKHSGKKPNDVAAQDILDARSTNKTLVLPIDKALDYAVTHSREFQSEKESLYLTALNLTGEKHNFFPQFFANSRGTRSRLIDGEQRGTVNSDIGVSQALLTGANIGVAIANDLLRYYTGDPRESAASVISLDIMQPLLRGAGRKIAGERLKQSHRNVFYGVRDFAHFQNTFSVDILMEYFRLLQVKDVIFNRYNNYLSIKASTDYLRARAVDRAKPEEVADSEQRELQAKDSYLNSITSFRNALDRFKIALGLPQTVDLRLDDSEMVKLRDAGLVELSLNTADGFRIALKHRLPLLNEVDRYEDSKRQVAIAADQLKADLNIFADTTVENDEGPTEYEKFNFNNVRANVGVQLNLPLDRLRERNQYRSTLISFESAIRRLGLNFDEVRNQIDRDIRQLEQLRKSYQIQKNAVTLAENSVEGNELRLKAGTITFQSLSDSQDDLIDAQNDVTGALVDYLEARLGLLTNLGILATDEETFWLRGDAVKVDLSKWRSAPTVTEAPTETSRNQVPTPEEVFAD